MTHISDLMFSEGVNGTRKAVFFLRDVAEMLESGNPKNKISVKIDGAPSVFAGIDPSDGRFFVAKKGIFNKEPVVYKTQSDIDAQLNGELRDKFSELLKYLPELGIRGIVQGDLLFSRSDLKRETIDGQAMITFHPNTIMYAVPIDSDMGKRVQSAKIGIAFHTIYTGDSLKNLTAVFGQPIVSKLTASKDVFAIDAEYKNDTGKATFTFDEQQEFDRRMSMIGKAFQKFPAELLNAIKSDSELLSVTQIYINSRIKKNLPETTGQKMAVEFHKFIVDRVAADVLSKKTDATKDKTRAKYKATTELFDHFGYEGVAALFDLFNQIEAAKKLVVTVLNRASSLGHYLRTKNGLRVTSPEGYVAINSQSGDAVKLVDRREFSMANFSPDIIKGWLK